MDGVIIQDVSGVGADPLEGNVVVVVVHGVLQMELGLIQCCLYLMFLPSTLTGFL